MQNEPGDPEMVAHRDALTWPHLELPLGTQKMGIFSMGHVMNWYCGFGPIKAKLWLHKKILNMGSFLPLYAGKYI